MNVCSMKQRRNQHEGMYMYVTVAQRVEVEKSSHQKVVVMLGYTNAHGTL